MIWFALLALAVMNLYLHAGLCRAEERIDRLDEIETQRREREAKACKCLDKVQTYTAQDAWSEAGKAAKDSANCGESAIIGERNEIKA
jgi:hypothetical protein